MFWFIFVAFLWENFYVRYTLAQYLKVRDVVDKNWNYVMKEIKVQGKFRDLGASKIVEKNIDNKQVDNSWKK